MTIVVAIDGLAGAGKSTLGQAIAHQLECAYVDTGLMYRAVTFAALERGVALSDAGALGRIARDLDFRLGSAGVPLLIDNAAPSSELRSPAVDRHVSEVSAHPEVRSALTAKQRQLAKGRGVVMVGRDIGTVVFPDAPVKLWVTASEETRAARRAGERREAGPGERQDVARDLAIRDRIDSGREVAPTRRPDGAVSIDTDLLNPPAALARALCVIDSVHPRVE